MTTTLEHEMLEVFDLDNELTYDAQAIYTLPGGGQLRVPYVNIVKYRDDLFADYRVFIDTHPLLSAPRTNKADRLLPQCAASCQVRPTPTDTSRSTARA